MKKKRQRKIRTAVAFLVLLPGALLAWALYCLASKSREVQTVELRNLLAGSLNYLALFFWIFLCLVLWLFNPTL